MNNKAEKSMVSNKKTAIVLGGTSPHAELIKKLKHRGYYIILVDYLENPLAAKVADEHIREIHLIRKRSLKLLWQEKQIL